MKKNNSKLLLCFLLMLTILIGSVQLSPIQAKEINISKINQELNIIIDESSRVSLYGENDEVSAYFYKLKDVGYIIIDVKAGEFIEYSTESNNLFINDTSVKYYYGGALNYFEEVSSDTIKEVNTNKIVNKEVAIIKRNNEDIKINIPQMRAFPVGTFSNSIPYKPRTYDTNTKDNCGSTAAAILMAYYYDHVSKVYVDSSLITSDGNALTKKMISYIEPNGGGSNYTTVSNGINNYLASRGLVKNAKKINLTQGAEKIYNNDQPVIAGVTKHPTYKEHWVVAYGFTMSNLLVKSYTVNNGWGQNGIIINSQYLDGAICI